MPFEVRTERRETVPGLDGTVYVLANPETGDRAEIWPALGFNCFRWQVRHQGQTLDLLYSDPKLFEDPMPTRSGIPILFPFPNRIRDGRFTWDGKQYQLPLNDPARKNAIHGFACRHPWRVIGQGADERSAWVQGEFQASVDAPEVKELWPADYRLLITYELRRMREHPGISLKLDAAVENTDTVTLPFGLGLHPYFRVPPAPGHACLIQVPADSYWELHNNLPTGACRLIDKARDLRQPRRFEELELDDVLTGLSPNGPIGRIRAAGATKGPTLSLGAPPSFREVVVFTPPHRQAVCIEPYTCLTDAINLQQSGISAGLLTLEPFEPENTWQGRILMLWHEDLGQPRHGS